ncbi:hypothetical protein [Marivita lacus]|uniref:hypothetical protein n=1 Tax=Marivita lacus TaxID=1323742 RepID=UPI00166C0C8F|nr:hypothetical protein [Marivita lacus]
MRYVVMKDEVRLLKIGSVADLEGALTHSGSMAVSLEDMDDAIATGAADEAQPDRWSPSTQCTDPAPFAGQFQLKSRRATPSCEL